jgi:hypothetical protein
VLLLLLLLLCAAACCRWRWLQAQLDHAGLQRVVCARLAPAAAMRWRAPAACCACHLAGPTLLWLLLLLPPMMMMVMMMVMMMIRHGLQPGAFRGVIQQHDCLQFERFESGTACMSASMWAIWRLMPHIWVASSR